MTDDLHAAARRAADRRTGDLGSTLVHRLVLAAFAAYLLVLAGVAFLPLPGAPAPGTVGEVAVNVSLSRPDLLGGWEARRNVLMTVPFGLLLPLVVRWRYEAMVLACAAVPVVIETGQLLGSLLAGWAWRSFDVDDIFNNTVGALLGLAVTTTVLLLVRYREDRGRWPRPAVRRLAVGTLAAALVVWAAVSTVTTPPVVPLVDACGEAPTGALTELPGGVTVYAVDDGSLCLEGPFIGSSSVPADVEPGVVLTVEHEGGGGFEGGVARPGAASATDGLGDPVQTYPVEGSDLLVWAASSP